MSPLPSVITTQPFTNIKILATPHYLDYNQLNLPKNFIFFIFYFFISLKPSANTFSSKLYHLHKSLSVIYYCKTPTIKTVMLFLLDLNVFDLLSN